MARRAFPLSLRVGPAVASLVLLATLGPMVVLFLYPGGPAIGAAEMAAIRFTLLQAALSALLSSALAVPLARALARRRFPGRVAVVTALGAPFLLPGIVAVLGLLAVFGRSGWANDVLSAAHLPAISIYGLSGVVLAHVFLNLPLATRMLLLGWQAIPGERIRLSQSLGFRPADTFRHIEAPMLRDVLPGAVLIIFAVCLTSFAVALTLGGGPGATTVELAIYQALRFDFDLPAAARLALVQIALCGVAFLLASRLALPAGFGAGLDRAILLTAPMGWRRAADATVILTAIAFVATPLLAIILRGAPHLLDLPPQVWASALRSVAIALAATTLGVTLALILALSHARGQRLPGLAATLPLAASSLVLGTGLFLILRHAAAPATLALPVTIAVNALLALPYAFRLLAPEARSLHTDYNRLSISLGLAPLSRLRFIILPRLSRPLGLAAGLSAALAMGDLGVIALFAGDGGATLPLTIQRLMGAYRMDQAAAAALVLVTLSFTLFAMFDQWGRRAAP